MSEEKEFEDIFIERLTGDDDELQAAIEAGNGKEKPGQVDDSSKLAQEYGGEGSGNWGHSGRPGQVGGSGDGGGYAETPLRRVFFNYAKV